MKTDCVKWGIIGCGDVCEYKSGPAFYKIPHSALAAVMRRDEAKAKDFAQRHTVQAYYTDATDLINDPNVDIIYVATPPGSHKTFTIDALRAGKPVYVEKPMAMNYAQCLEMCNAATHAGQKLFVAYYRRALPYFLKVKELIDAGCIGKPITVSVNYFRQASENDTKPETQPWRVQKDIAGEGYFFDMAPHTLDILDFLLGEIHYAKGFKQNLGGYYAVADTVAATFEFESGVLGSGMWCFASSPNCNEDSVTIRGTKGSIRFASFTFEPICLTTTVGEELFAPPMPEHIQQPLIQTIVDELLGKGKCPSTAQSGARTSKVMDWIML